MAQFWVLFFTCTMRLVGVLNFGNSSSLWSKAKRSCSQSYPHALSASPTVGSTACTCVLDSLYSPWDDALAHWWCPGLEQIVRDLLHQRYFPMASLGLACWTFKTGPKCSTSCEWDPYPATQAAKASFTAFLHHVRSQATNCTRRRTPWMSELFFSSAKVVTLREFPLSLAKNTKTWAPRQRQQRAIFVRSSPTSSWRRTTTMLINLGSRVPFTDSFPARQATRKTVALHSTLLVLLGEKSGRWSSSPHHGAFSNRSCAHRFAPKWSALPRPDSQ